MSPKKVLPKTINGVVNYVRSLLILLGRLREVKGYTKYIYEKYLTLIMI